LALRGRRFFHDYLHQWFLMGLIRQIRLIWSGGPFSYSSR